MSKEIILVCPRCQQRMSQVRALAAKDGYYFRENFVITAGDLKPLPLNVYVCFRCGTVSLWLASADQEQPHKPTAPTMHFHPHIQYTNHHSTENSVER